MNCPTCNQIVHLWQSDTFIKHHCGTIVRVEWPWVGGRWFTVKNGFNFVTRNESCDMALKAGDMVEYVGCQILTDRTLIRYFRFNGIDLETTYLYLLDELEPNQPRKITFYPEPNHEAVANNASR